jgi:hypothetical protein
MKCNRKKLNINALHQKPVENRVYENLIIKR